jgi:3',5'-nucleoside bisphosphate phosphatase
MSAELHCHSLYSVDAFATPEAHAESAAGRGVTTFALTDHNTLEGLPRARARAAELGIRFINGIELDIKHGSEDFHTVAFGFDPDNRELLEVCAKNFAQYEINFARWMPVIEGRFGVTREELQEDLATYYPGRPNPVLNKWHARYYMIEKGVFADREAALREMSSVGTEAEGHLPNEELWPFVRREQAVAAVHGAGGIILLAHVGGSRQTLAEQLALIEEMLAAGFDGFELYHGANTRYQHFEQLVAAGRKMNCALSGGTDAHRALPPEAFAQHHFEVPDWVIETLDAALARRNRNSKEIS